jgi:medium-chain acyl-[acyl-carrier-protein] hydrolase
MLSEFRDPWVVRPKPRSAATLKLLCFPYAGGGASVYQAWADQLPAHVELNIVQLPGRGTHLCELPIDCMNRLTDILMSKISDIINCSYVVFGHSLGSRIAFEVVRRLQAAGKQPPLHFFASGSGSPKQPGLNTRTSELPDPEFIAELRQMNGTPDEVLENHELMQLLLPMLRADFRLAETYSYAGDLTIPTGLTVLSGRHDEICPTQLGSWADFFAVTEMVECEGGHFFINTHSQQVLDVVNDRLNKLTATYAV